MVTYASALGRNGVHDWLLLRASAILIVLFVVYLLGFVLVTDTLTYSIWRGFFALTLTKVLTSLALFSVLIHGWIGMWQVLTDYIKCVRLRLLLQFLVVVTLLVYAFYGSIVVWRA